MIDLGSESAATATATGRHAQEEATDSGAVMWPTTSMTVLRTVSESW